MLVIDAKTIIEFLPKLKVKGYSDTTGSWNWPVALLPSLVLLQFH